ncbi:MAG TPA: hypothetical protein ENN31_01590 [Candidatus Vogelbacteria bacterium]|nr:hypothetical protein [Candidatus Vogelbacteria bacterium]
MNSKKIRIHNPMAALPGFTFSGIEAYSTRAMTDCGGLTIIADCHNPVLLRQTAGYYRRLGLGPDELILVQTSSDGDLYQAITKDKALSSRIVQLVKKEGYKIEFFCTRDKVEADFLKCLGLNWSDTVSHPPELADFWNNKAHLRSRAKDEGLRHLFPEHYIIDSENDLLLAVVTILESYPEVVIKRPLWASGQGMFFGNNIETAYHFRDYHGIPAGTIVERSLGSGHLPMSVITQFFDGQIIDQWFTEQQCCLNGQTISFDGFVIGDLPQVTDEDLLWLSRETAKLYKIVLKDNPRLTGTINFDCLRLEKERFVLECNARLTFSSYVQEIRRSLMSSGYSSNNCFMVHRVDLVGITDFTSLQNKLGNTLFDFSQEEGVIPITVGCLATSGYCYLVSITHSYQQALRVMHQAKLKLTR